MLVADVFGHLCPRFHEYPPWAPAVERIPATASALHVDACAIHDVLGAARCPLPFVREAVSTDRRLAAAIVPALDDLGLALDELHRDQIVLDLADALVESDP